MGYQFEQKSPKVKGRSVRFFTELHFQNYLLIESDSKIEIFCEYPDLDIVAIVNNKRITSSFDMWVKWVDGTEEFQRIETENTLEEFDSNPHSHPKLLALSIWANQNQQNFRIVTDKIVRARPILLENWSDILPYLYNVSWVVEHGLDKAILDFIGKHKHISFDSIINYFSETDPNEIITGTLWNMYNGLVSADLERAKLTRTTEFMVSR